MHHTIHSQIVHKIIIKVHYITLAQGLEPKNFQLTTSFKDAHASYQLLCSY